MRTVYVPQRKFCKFPILKEWTNTTITTDEGIVLPFRFRRINSAEVKVDGLPGFTKKEIRARLIEYFYFAVLAELGT